MPLTVYPALKVITLLLWKLLVIFNVLMPNLLILFPFRLRT